MTLPSASLPRRQSAALPSLSLCCPPSIHYTHLLCVLYTERTSCAVYCSSFSCLPMIAVDISAARGQSPPTPSAACPLFAFFQKIDVVSCLLHTNAHHADGHTRTATLTYTLAISRSTYVCCYAWVVVRRTHTKSLHSLPRYPPLSPRLIEDDAKGDNVKRQLFETISTHCRSHTHSHTQPAICRLGWNKTNTRRVAVAIIANPLCV